MTLVAKDKEKLLRHLIADYRSLAVAYSGGVDSTYLSAIAHEAVNRNAHIVLADSASIPRSELNDAVSLAEQKGWNLSVIQTEEFEDPAYLANDANRCYLCKTELFEKMSAFARTHQIPVLAYGAIEDDKLDHRPGQRAADEYRVVAPLQDAGLSKKEIRELSEALGLPTAGKASFACLSSRFPTGSRISNEKVKQVEAVEELLKRKGFYQYRARHHGDICRIELDPVDFQKMMAVPVREEIVAHVKALGFRFVTLDLAGYHTGSTAARPVD